jgi:post-segregation antitoxin (ccd killing protein)
MAGTQQAQQASYQAQVARQNAKIAKMNASTALQTGLDNARTKGLETRDLIGKEKAAQGASGIDVTSGSSKMVRDSTYVLGKMDEMTIMKGAAQKGDAYMAQAMNYQAEAGLYDMKADAAETARNFAVASTLVGGAQSLSQKWGSYQSVGMA